MSCNKTFFIQDKTMENKNNFMSKIGSSKVGRKFLLETNFHNCLNTAKVGTKETSVLINFFSAEFIRSGQHKSPSSFFFATLLLFFLELKNLVDPVPELRDPSVDTWLVLLCATDAPADDSGQHEPSVRPLNHHWPTTVTLKYKI